MSESTLGYVTQCFFAGSSPVVPSGAWWNWQTHYTSDVAKTQLIYKIQVRKSKDSKDKLNQGRKTKGRKDKPEENPGMTLGKFRFSFFNQNFQGFPMGMVLFYTGAQA